MPDRIDYLFTAITRYPLVTFAISVLLATVLITKLNGKGLALAVGACGLLFLTAKTRLIRMSLVLGLLLAGLQSFRYINIDDSHISMFTDIGTEVVLTGVIVTDPYIRNSQRKIVVSPTTASLPGDEKEQTVSGGLVLLTVDQYADLTKGMQVEVVSLLEQPKKFNEFDYQAYLRSQDIYATGRPGSISVLSEAARPYERVIRDVKVLAQNMIKKSLPEPHASLLVGMLMGTREEFPGGFASELQATGTTHIIAVSGYNVSVLLALILGFAGTIHRRYLIYFSFLLLSFFILLVGLDNLPAVRATIMGFAFLVGYLVGRKGAVLSSLGLAASLMVLANPFVYASLSFQLSFASTLGLVFIQEKILTVLPRFLGEQVLEELSVTLAAITATFPITFGNFGSVTPWAVLANLLAAPLVSIIMAFGGIMLIVGSIGIRSVPVFVYLTWIPLELLVTIVRVVSKFPFAKMTISEGRNIIAFAFLMFLVLFVFEVNYRKHLDING